MDLESSLIFQDMEQGFDLKLVLHTAFQFDDPDCSQCHK
jgi:hypothetical protein